MKRILVIISIINIISGCSEQTQESSKEENVMALESSESELDIDLDSDSDSSIIITDTNTDTNTYFKTNVKVNPEDNVKLNSNSPETIEKLDTLKEVKVDETDIPPNHTLWNNILQRNVSPAGKVNYSAMKNELSLINEYINNLEALTDKKKWSKNENLAFWINLYNAATVRMISENYPLSSITDLSNGKPWDKVVVQVDGTKYTLNEIENKVIRPKFNEPRIHFAINCAAKSCPQLLNEAFIGDKLNYQLEKQTKAFVNSNMNEINTSSIKISKIFDWYKDDFNDLVSFLNKYSATQINPNANIEFKEYDWSLNE